MQLAALLLLSGCDVPKKEKEEERSVDVGDTTTVRDQPIRRTDGTVWNFHWLFTDRDRMDNCVKTEEYLQAEEDSVAYRLQFGTRMIITKVEPGFKWWATDFKVEVLDGQHAGKIGWIDFNALGDYYRGQRP